ncbi:hypothetical protein NUW58_g1845 [Xylaria curta]|uniref:Uncharacterized protein n=1 Tax=Xylaria curta TaxID=42375 RepID=A0ACC1PK10_9PEZI|nr:hypothetical protein NUW58_g1845 [Xylaria curta]
MEPRARAGKHVGKETFNPKEIAALLYAYGDVHDPIPETVRVLDEIVTEFLEGVCFEASRHAQVAGRQKLKFDDFEFALRRNPQYLGKVKAMIEKRQTIKEMRKTFNQDDDALMKDMAARDKDTNNAKQEEDELLGLDDDLDLKELGAETSSRGSGAKKRKVGVKPKSYNVKESQDAPGDPTSSTSDLHREADKQSKIDTDQPDTGNLRCAPDSPFSQDGRTSPIPSLRDHFLPPAALARAASASPHGIVSRIRKFCASQWRKHRAPIFVFGAQFFGALMNLFARLVELNDTDQKLHPMQLLLWRMSLTMLTCSIYIIKQRIPHGVLGSPGVRLLLLTRGASGFFGIYGVWYSIQYLPLAEATVITFLAPLLAGYWCHLFLKDPYTRTEQLASFLALGGVVLITRPTSLFSDAAQGGETVQAALDAIVNATTMTTRGIDTTGSAVTDTHTPTTSERIGAIGMSLLGVLGTSVAFTTLRAIGPRAHTLISVNYFSGVCVIVTFSVLSFAPLLNVGQPELRLGFPSSIHQCGLLLLITICGLATQVLITKGLSAERSNRATAMTYTQMLFAAGFDRFVWGTTMGWVSATGCAMIIAGAVWVAAGKNGAIKGRGDGDEADIERAEAARTRDIEGVPMLGGELEEQDEDIVLRTIR